jgi:hypothetical protein
MLCVTPHWKKTGTKDQEKECRTNPIPYAAHRANPDKNDKLESCLVPATAIGRDISLIGCDVAPPSRPKKLGMCRQIVYKRSVKESLLNHGSPGEGRNCG